MFILGLDIGGTKTEAAVLRIDHNSGKFQIIARLRTPTHRHEGFETILNDLVDLIKKVLIEAKVDSKSLAGIGIGLPGSVDPKTMKMSFGNTMALIGKDLPQKLKFALKVKCKVVCENDANCFALAEALHGAGLTHSKKIKKAADSLTSVGIILGTGVGGGIILSGKIHSGRLGGAGEIGHTELYTNGHPCYCGRNGCAENYLSGAALEATFGTRMYSQIKERPDAKGVIDLYRKKDPAAVACVLQYKRDLGKFLGNLQNVFDPDYFVLGGGMSNVPEVYSHLKDEIQKHCFLPHSAPDIYRNELGDSAGVIGAAILAYSK